MNVPPETRRANVVLFACLIVFAVGLCVLIFVWMRGVTKRQGGVVYPPTSFYEDGVNRVQGRFFRSSFFGVAPAPCFCQVPIA